MKKKTEMTEELNVFEEGMIFLPPRNRISTVMKKGKQVLIYDLEFPGNAGYLDIMNYYPSYFEEQGWKRQDKPDYQWLLKDLLSIEDQGEEQVLDFISKWGPVWACEHDFHDLEITWTPIQLPPEPVWIVTDYYKKVPFEERLLRWRGSEELERYYIIARRASAVLQSARLLEKGEPVSPELLSRVTYSGDTKLFRKMYDPDDLSVQQTFLVETVNDYLGMTVGQKLKAELNENISSHSLRYDPGWGFLWALWLEIMNVISRTSDLYMCDWCGRVYRRDSSRRKPKPGLSNYCQKCADNRAAWKSFDKKRKTEK